MIQGALVDPGRHSCSSVLSIYAAHSYLTVLTTNSARSWRTVRSRKDAAHS